MKEKIQHLFLVASFVSALAFASSLIVETENVGDWYIYSTKSSEFDLELASHPAMMVATDEGETIWISPNVVEKHEGLVDHLRIPDDQELWYVETLDENAAIIPGTLWHQGRFSLVAIARNADHLGHLHIPGVWRSRKVVVSGIDPVVMANLLRMPTRPTFTSNFESEKTSPLGVNGNLISSPPPDFLREVVEILSGERGVTIGNKTITINERGSEAGRRHARMYMKQLLSSWGYEVEEHRYRTGTNIIARRPQDKGKSGFYVVSAHYDSVNNPGADDDASGIASALFTAYTLRSLETNYGLVFAAFDEEELGLLGSAALASKWAKDGSINNLMGLFQMEMTGYDNDQDGGIHIIDCLQGDSPLLTKLVEDSIDNQQLTLTKFDACTNASDHSSFWRYKRPAIVMSQNFFGRPSDANPCYHRSCDKVDILNFVFMQKISSALSYAVATALTSN